MLEERYCLRHNYWQPCSECARISNSENLTQYKNIPVASLIVLTQIANNIFRRSLQHGLLRAEISEWIIVHDYSILSCKNQSAQAARKFIKGEISAGKFGELLGLEIGELHDFKKTINNYNIDF